MSDIYTPRHFNTFEEVMQSHPVVHAHMTSYLVNGLNYNETLRKIIVDLANRDEELMHYLASMIAGQPSIISFPHGKI